MDANGLNSSNGLPTATDLCMYLLDLDKIEFFNVKGVYAQNVPLAHSSDSGVRYDVTGGYIKSYCGLRFKEFTRHVLITELTVPA